MNQVVRVGDTVRRTVGPWSHAVHGLLQHLETRGFTGVPRFLGIDEKGRETLTYIGGEVGFMPYVWHEESLVAAARLLRAYHDAVEGYMPHGARWQFIYPDSRRHDIICHNDFAPYNVVFQEERPFAVIDFDAAGPGPRIWDIGYAAYCFVPVSYAPDRVELGLADPAVQARRLELFCDAYGLEDRSALLQNIEGRIRAMANLLTSRSTAGEPAFQKLVAEGHLDYYKQELASFRIHKPELERLLHE